MNQRLATVEELKDVITLVVEMVEGGIAIAQDGHLGLGDITQVWSIIEKIGPAFTGIGQIPAELKDLTLGEVDELTEFVGEEMDGMGEAVELTQKILRALRAGYEVYLAVRGV